MRYTIITPTLVRPSLRRLCRSIDIQTNEDWEHIIVIDTKLTEEKIEILNGLGKDPRRKILVNSAPHPNDYGNMARRLAFLHARGEYILHIDDDDYYADADVFKTLEMVSETWAVYPVLAMGRVCHAVPPKIHQTGSAMFIYRRDTCCTFPDNADYSADGQLVEELKSKFWYQALDVRPLVIYEKANHGIDPDSAKSKRFNV